MSGCLRKEVTRRRVECLSSFWIAFSSPHTKTFYSRLPRLASGCIGPSPGRVFCLNLNLPLSVRHIFRFLWSTIVRLSLSCTTELGSFTPPIQAGVAVKTHFYWRVHFPLLFSTQSCCCLILRVARLVGVQGPDLATMPQQDPKTKIKYGSMRKWSKLNVATIVV